MRIFIAKNPLQIKFLALILASILLPLLLAVGCLYYLIFQVMAEQLAIPESIAYNLIPVVEKINFLLIVSLPPAVALIFIGGLILTHRLIGPLKRLEDDLTKIAAGDYSIRLNIRKDDDLRPIAEAMNKIIDKLEKK